MLKQRRIEFIDLAKGITILIIALTHTYGDSGGFFMEIFSIFKVPTFFALSGIFFKTYESTCVFLKKKINQLVIPLVFTYLFLSLPWNILLELYSGHGLSITNLIFMSGTNRLNFGMAPGAWFVLCLLFIEIFFYCLFIIFRENVIVISFVAFVAGISGYLLNVYGISIPLWVDSALTSMPFFLFGLLIGRYSSVLKSEMLSTYWLVWAFSSLIFLYCIFLLGDGEIFYAGNRYSVNVIFLFVGGAAGILIVLLLSKAINTLPLVSFIGRHSLIMLLTHQLYLFFLRNIVYQLNIQQDNYFVSFILFVIVVLLSFPTIHFCKKYLPWAFGLKNVVK